ncbi:tyrosine-type recombinase/integrase [Kitasatospora gansuensis]
MKARWDGAPAKTRTTWADALATVTFELVRTKVGRPDKRVLRRALYSWAFNPTQWVQEPRAEWAKALAWVERQSINVSALAELTVARQLLDAASVKLDGKKAAASSVLRKRRILHHVLGRAVEEKLLTVNPIPLVQWQPPKIEEEVDPEYVLSPEQITASLAEIGRQGRRGPRMVAFFACLYYAGMRPAEVVHLRKNRCVLPEEGWGKLNLNGSSPRVGSAWTDSGTSHDPRSLKHRADKATRPVPIPPVLVQLLREHIEKYGTAPDGRLFQTFRGGLVQESSYGVVWSKARAEVLTAEQQETPLGDRPYDWRHAGISGWLASGVAPAECARRAGHSIAVLHRVYAKCIHGDEERANQLIGQWLDGRARPAPESGP